MALLFTDSWKRIDRAKAHAKAFDIQWNALIDPESYATAIKMNSDWTTGVVQIVPKRPLPNNDLALELGEMFYQLRASLDAAVYQATILSGGFGSPSDESRVEFPIYPTPTQFERNPINKPPFPKDLRDWLESIQFYNVEKVPNPTFVRALQLLHDCARKDRHRRLHVVAASPTSVDWQFAVTEPGRITSVQNLPANLFENETEFLLFHLDGARPESNIEIKLNAGTLVEVSVDEIPSNSSLDLGNKINWIFDSTTSVIERFENFFRG